MAAGVGLMKTFPIRIILFGKEWISALSLASALLISTGLTTRAGPVFPLPDPFGAHPGFGVNLPPTGPGFLPPGGALPSLFFTDAIPSPDVGHLELEINNPNAFAIAFDLGIVFPGGPIAGTLTLPAGSSAYFDIGYVDAPPEAGPPMWSLSATAAPGTPLGGGITLDADIIETGGPTHPPGLALFMSAGPGGAGMFGPPSGGPAVTIMLAVVPEPSVFALLGAGLAGLLAYARTRKNKLD